MCESYYLSPFATISPEKSGFKLGSLLEPKESMYINSLTELINMSKDNLEWLFVHKKKINQYKNRAFYILEKTFENQVDTVGYVETTARCPYHCQICPKSNQKQRRVSWELSLSDLDNLLSQISKAKKLTFHVFGDPLLDKNIFEKISLANRYGIKPSFSTNLISLLNLELFKFNNIKLSNLTISFDSLESMKLSEIRGGISKEHLEKSIDCLIELGEQALKIKNIETIYLQRIDLKNNQEDEQKLKFLANKNPLFHYVKKKFITFPTVNSSLSTVEKIEFGETTLLYRALKAKLPFQCLKPWFKNETCILSDGSYSPCCMLLNDEFQLGNLKSKTMSDYFSSRSHGNFRKNIFNSSIGGMCQKCRILKNRVQLPDEISEFDIKILRKFCLSDWETINEKNSI
ncbi:hypothetical protein RyT2_17570 [Pseudolactococcus yaeyamensis]